MKNHYHLTSLIYIFFLAFISIQSFAQTAFKDDYVVQALPMNLDQPVGIVFSNNGLGFIWEKKGKVWTMEDDVIHDTPLIDITEEVNSAGDHGLVGFALDPSFRTNGYYYLYYVVDRHHLMSFGTEDYDPEVTISSQATISRITRYTADKNDNFKSTLEGSRKIILGETPEGGLPVLMGSHAPGTLLFGTDGSLLATYGDGGSYKEFDSGNAADTYHEQAMEDGILPPEENVGAFRSMMKSSGNGKMLRIDPETGAGLESNPFYDPSNPYSNQSRVWAMGFRNAYKFVQIPNTGEHDINRGKPGKFIVGDVGSSDWEEISLLEEPGQWFGWPFFEGFRRRWQFYSRDIPNPETPSDEECQEMYYFEDIMTNKRQDETYMFESPCGGTIPEEYQYIHRPPLLAWSNQEWNPPVRTNVEGYDENGVLTGLSITDPSSPVDGFTFAGGSVLTGDFNLYNQFEEEMSGKLFFGDFKGFVSVITFDENYNVVKVDPFIDEEKGMTDITFDPSSGSLYYVHLYRNELMKVTYGGTLPPTIIAEQSKEFGPSPLEVSFDATDSYSNVDGDLSYEWILPNGEIVKEEVFNYEFTSNEPQELEITLTVTDSIGQQSHESFHISINNTPPVVNITSVKDGDTYSMQRTNVVPLKAEVSDAETLTENLIFGWQVELHHDSHYHPGPTDFRQETFAFLDPVGCETEVYRYKVILTVTDEHGLSTVDSLYLNPYCGEEFSEIINLSANYHDGIVNLNWSENLPISGISHFKIEKSDDYIFREIAQLNASEKIDYFYNDNLPYIGPNIYRIKAYDHNGNYLYSNEVEINIEMLTDYFIYPNPVEDIINVIIQNEKQLETQINIIDMSGKLVRTITPTAAIQIAEQIDLSDFQSGVYYIMIANNEDRFLNRIIKL